MTPYQHQQAKESIKIFRRKILNTDECDRNKAEDAVHELRQSLAGSNFSSSNTNPLYHWVNSPREFVALLQRATSRECAGMYRIGRKEFLSDRLDRALTTRSYRNMPSVLHQASADEIWRYSRTLDFGSRLLQMLDPMRCLTEKIENKMVSLPLSRELVRPEIGQFNIDSLWTNHFVAEHYYLSGAREEMNINFLKRLLAVASSCAFWWNHESAVFLCERPKEIHVDDRGRLHSTQGPAVVFRDGLKLYAICGIEMRKEIFENGEVHLRAKTIDETRNAEVRRVLMEMYGPEKYLKKTGAVIIHHGRDGRRLWLRPQASDEPTGVPLVMVELINSTPEPDGTHKHYFLRVLPDIRDADEAVASTFRLAANDYRPQVET